VTTGLETVSAIKPVPNHDKKPAGKPASTVTLICWNATEGREHADSMRQAGFKVTLEFESRRGPAILRHLREHPPEALVIDLGRLPSHGRDVALAVRTGRQTRRVPLVFVDGEPAKVERVRSTLPDAVYTSWDNVASAVKRALAKPNPDPVVPNSNLAGYSGTPLPKKLGIMPRCSAALLGEPEGFAEILDPLPPAVEFTNRINRSTGVAIWFVRSAAELASRIDSVARQVIAAKSCRLWIAWPKRTSRLAGDVSENQVRAVALAAGLVDYKVAAIDADWSGLLFALRKD
jgi:hypothetical protein